MKTEVKSSLYERYAEISSMQVFYLVSSLGLDQLALLRPDPSPTQSINVFPFMFFQLGSGFVL